MNIEESNTAKALKLVDSGISKAAAAKECGISRQAIDDGLKRRVARQTKSTRRQCSECDALLPVNARADANTCSAKCRTARSRRLAKEKGAAPVPAEVLDPDDERRRRIDAERARLGLPALSRKA